MDSRDRSLSPTLGYLIKRYQCQARFRPRRSSSPLPDLIPSDLAAYNTHILSILGPYSGITSSKPTVVSLQESRISTSKAAPSTSVENDVVDRTLTGRWRRTDGVIQGRNTNSRSKYSHRSSIGTFGKRDSMHDRQTFYEAIGQCLS